MLKQNKEMEEKTSLGKYISKKKKKYVLSLSLLCIGLFGVIILGIMIGPVQIHPFTIVNIFLHKLGFNVEQTWSNIVETIVLDVRTPRVIMAAFVGACLAVAGAAMQGLFKNPMAEPYILGMSQGAAVGAALVIVLGISFFGGFSLQAMAFIGALLTIFIVYGIARVEGKVPVETLLLAGVAMGAFLYAVVGFLKFISSDVALRDIVLWLMGSFASAKWDGILQIFFPMLISIIGIFALAKELNAMQFGENTASYVGVNVEKTKKIILVFSSLLTAAAVAYCGIIGFVGLIIPHIVRILIGADHHILIPASALTGAIFLALADTFARTIIAPTELPVGIVTALIGGPYFIYLLRRKKRTKSWW